MVRTPVVDGSMEGWYVSNLAPLVFVQKEDIAHVEGVHHKQQQARFVDVPDIVAKNEHKG